MYIFLQWIDFLNKLNEYKYNENTEYKLKLLDKVRNFGRRVRFKNYFCTDEQYNTNLIENKETYGFKSKFMPDFTDERREFEN